MDTLKSLIDAAKLTVYELLAVLLPGAVLAEAGVHGGYVTFGSGTAGAVRLLGAAYVLGLATQGLAHLLFRRLPRLFRSDRELEGRENGKQAARRLAEQLIGHGVDDDLLFDFCLSRIGKSRTTYDRFLALQDAARALVLVVPIGLAYALPGGASPGLRHPPLLVLIFGLGLGVAGLLDRYLRFRQAGDRVVYAEFLAAEVGKTPGDRGVEAK
jgi:hypothetical protein